MGLQNSHRVWYQLAASVFVFCTMSILLLWIRFQIHGDNHQSNANLLGGLLFLGFLFLFLFFSLVLASGFWPLAFGFWILAFGFLLLAFGFWHLASGFWRSRSHLLFEYVNVLHSFRQFVWVFFIMFFLDHGLHWHAFLLLIFWLSRFLGFQRWLSIVRWFPSIFPFGFQRGFGILAF